MSMSNDNEQNVPSSEDRNVRSAAEVVDHGALVIRQERNLRKVQRALAGLGLTAITGRDWAYVDQESGEVRFRAVPASRVWMLVDFFDHLAALTQPSRIRSGDVAVNVQIDHLQIEFHLDL